MAASSPSARAWWSRRSWPAWAGLAAGYIALYGLWLLIRPPVPAAHALGQLSLVLPGLLAARAALALRRSPRLASGARRLWMFLGLALALWTAGGGLWPLYRLLAGARPPVPSLADPVYMAGHLLALAALLTLPILPRASLGRVRVLLDLFTLSVVGLALGWVLLLQPVLSGLAERPAETLWTAVYPALDLALLILIFNLALVVEPAEGRPALGFVAAGLAAVVVADLAYTYLGLRGQVDDDTLFDLGRLIGFALLGLGARLQAGPDPVAAPAARWRWIRRLQASLPLAAGIAFGWYTTLDWQTTGTLDPVAALTTAVLGVALVARQGVIAGEVELGQYAQLVEGAADPAFICDARGALRLANPALAAALGRVQPEEILGASLFTLIVPEALPPELRVPPSGFSPLVLEGGWSGEVRLRRTDGSDFPVYLSLRPVPSDPGARPVLAGTAHDLSVQKRQQAALVAAYEAAAAARRTVEELNAQLEAKVDEKTRSLSEAYAQLERQNEALKTLDRLKSEFVSLVSHELRAPLTNIGGGMELVLALGADLGPRTRERLALVQAEVRRLSRFVETILDLSALEAGRLPLTPAPLSLADVAEALRAQLAATPHGRRLRLALPADLPAVLADERALSSVLFHLVDNALKYAPDGEVLITAEAAPAEAGRGRVRVAVSDHGPGISPEQRAAIFERFQRLNAGDAQAVYGHGLGLYMVRQWLRAMDGDIGVDDAPGGGARFTFELPAAEDEV